MRHFSFEQWAEFSRSVVSADQSRAMQQHLDEGCDSCAELKRLCTAICQAGAHQSEFAPPDGIVRNVKAHFHALAAMDAAPSGIELLFDSLLQPAIGGTRASVASARQILFKVGTIFLDFRVELEPNAESATLVGQVLDSATPRRPLADVPVVVQAAGEELAGTVSSRTGEFQLDFPLRHDLQMWVKLPRMEPISLPLTSLSAPEGGQA